MKKNIKPFLWLTAIGFLLYLPSLFFNFTYLDDNILILDNLQFLTQPANLVKAFQQEVFYVSHFATAYYRPILTVSFMIDSWISGASPFFYHFSNILIHLLVINLFFIFLTKLKIKRELSFLGALIFAVHPVLTQAVSWIPGRNDSLLMLFVLLSFIAVINYNNKRADPSASRSPSSLLWHFIFFLLALFTKESALALVPLIIFYFWIMADTKLPKKALIKLSIGWLFIVLFWLAMRHNAFTDPIPFSPIKSLQAIIMSLPAIIQFVGKIFLPLNLSVLPILQDTTLRYGIIALTLLGALIIYSLPKQKNYWRYCLFGLLWFLGFLVPSFLKPSSAIAPDFIEHRVYVPMAGLFVILFQNDLISKLNFSKKSILAIFGVIILLFGAKNITYQQNFKNRLNFWQNAAQNSPHSPLAHRNLGVMYYFKNNFAEALKHYQISLRLNPEEPMTHNNIGVLLMNQDKLDEAAKEFLEELKFNPYYDNALSNLGLIYYRQNKKDKAAELWKEAIRVNPYYLTAYKNLILYYQDKKDFERADYYMNLLK